MWIESGYTNKSGIDAVMEYLRQNNINYVLITEGEDNEVSVSVGEIDKMDFITYKVENNKIYMYEE